jgi:FkbM family methyltransferase
MNINLDMKKEETHLNILKIGAYMGCKSDSLFGQINESMKIIFIEPIEKFILSLKEYHKIVCPNNKFIYVQKAISDKEGKMCLYTPSITNDFSVLPHWIEQCTSKTISHIRDHAEKEVDLDIIWVKCTTIKKVLQTFNINSIDWITIDTEGCDYEILMNYDFFIKPKYISFEHLHMDGFKRTGEKYEKLIKFLIEKGYEVVLKNEMDTYCRLI